MRGFSRLSEPHERAATLGHPEIEDGLGSRIVSTHARQLLRNSTMTQVLRSKNGINGVLTSIVSSHRHAETILDFDSVKDRIRDHIKITIQSKNPRIGAVPFKKVNDA